MSEKVRVCVLMCVFVCVCVCTWVCEREWDGWWIKVRREFWSLTKNKYGKRYYYQRMSKCEQDPSKNGLKLGNKFTRSLLNGSWHLFLFLKCWPLTELFYFIFPSTYTYLYISHIVFHLVSRWFFGVTTSLPSLS